MIKSMTGYGIGSIKLPSGNLNLEFLRSFITFIDEGIVSFLVVVSNKLPIAT